MTAECPALQIKRFPALLVEFIHQWHQRLAVYSRRVFGSHRLKHPGDALAASQKNDAPARW